MHSEHRGGFLNMATQGNQSEEIQSSVSAET